MIKTKKLVIELEYDASSMHGGDPAGISWFENEILSDSGNLVLHCNEIGDLIGFVKVISHEDA